VPAIAVAGDSVELATTVKNVGDTIGAGGGFTVRFYDGDPALGHVIGEARVGPLGVDESQRVSVTWDSTHQEGSHLISVVADVNDEVNEFDEFTTPSRRPCSSAGPWTSDRSIGHRADTRHAADRLGEGAQSGLPRLPTRGPAPGRALDAGRRHRDPARSGPPCHPRQEWSDGAAPVDLRPSCHGVHADGERRAPRQCGVRRRPVQ